MVFMSDGKQSRLSAAQRADVWRRWKAGESLHEIGRACGKPHNCIRCVLLPSGGIAPTTRRRSGVALTLAEREDISRGIASGSSIRAIASGLDRAASTVSREVTRHGGRSAYRALDADKLRTLSRKDGWIIDGDLGQFDIAETRLRAADTVIFLDFSFSCCAHRAIRRSRERIDFWWWVLAYRWKSRPVLLKAIADYAPSAELHVFRNPDSLQRFVDQLVLIA